MSYSTFETQLTLHFQDDQSNYSDQSETETHTQGVDIWHASHKLPVEAGVSRLDSMQPGDGGINGYTEFGIQRNTRTWTWKDSLMKSLVIKETMKPHMVLLQKPH